MYVCEIISAHGIAGFVSRCHINYLYMLAQKKTYIYMMIGWIYIYIYIIYIIYI